MITNRATVVQWNDEKGFGFATANGVKYFVHQSALGRTARPPKVGDTITVGLFGKGEKGPRIEKGTLDGVDVLENVRPVRSSNSKAPRRNKAFRKFMFSLCIVLMVISGIYTLADKFFASGKSSRSIAATEATVSGSQYTTKDEVAKFICNNGYLPSNYVSKKEGIRLYERKTGRAFERWNFNPQRMLGVMIGGDVFENREGKLPSGSYKEADVDYFENNRGRNRLIYGDNCNIYYTSDHYESFSKMNLR
jgi:cold shock CspA family protein